ncbi:MAG: hypothetical protein RLY21_2649 [Planctomycetota bacterium]|jgi:hypothetical protein
MQRKLNGVMFVLVAATCAEGARADLVDAFTTGSSVSGTLFASTGQVAVTGGLFDRRQVEISTYLNNPRMKSVDIAGGALSYTVTVASPWAYAVTSWSLSNGRTVDMSRLTSFSFDYSMSAGSVYYDLTVATASGSGFVFSPTAIAGSGTVQISLQDLGAQGFQLSAVDRIIFSLRQFSGAATDVAVTNFSANGVAIPAAGTYALVGLAGIAGRPRRAR